MIRIKCITVGSCKKVMKLLKQFSFILLKRTSSVLFDQARKCMLMFVYQKGFFG